ncbi:DUF2334 domain-containing protein [Adlercreutzia sp. ZJ154]|uniref:DUF2334 domain-containing protein n=1 Tax=Adlercreutzia sp. ZJ154 TaxID=2709790 RepID=UPI0013EBD67A|nr:DUF2334 domain-containing protein [Adlercreutzia sp. ZJ154]
MSQYIIRLDDASEYMNLEKWRRIEHVLDNYGIKPIFGVIPNNCDSDLISYGHHEGFWELATMWCKKGWTPALHGYCHQFVTNDGGINPVNMKSEFAGLSYQEQAEKIKKGYQILTDHGIVPEIFFAPAHTFDNVTLDAIRKNSDIRVISDTIANDTYYMDGFYFIPQQSGRCRKLPFQVVTFCYHPNTMKEEDFASLDSFCAANNEQFCSFGEVELKKRKPNIFDALLKRMYFGRRR